MGGQDDLERSCQTIWLADETQNYEIWVSGNETHLKTDQPEFLPEVVWDQVEFVK